MTTQYREILRLASFEMSGRSIATRDEIPYQYSQFRKLLQPARIYWIRR